MLQSVAFGASLSSDEALSIFACEFWVGMNLSRIHWCQSAVVLAIVLSPIGLAAVITAIGIAVQATWQMGQGEAVRLPAPENVRLYGLLSYAAGSWIAVALAWFWSKRHEMQRQVFVFRRLTWPSFAGSIVASVIVIFGVPVLTHWLTQITGARSQNIHIDFNDARSVAIVVFLFVVTSPVTEEVLYRGLLVTWLRRLGWKDLNIVVLGSLVFAANHILPLGLVWSVAMILLGTTTNVLRLRYKSLSPGWLTHALFNAQLTLSHPLIAWLV
jgi:membrane protease YdiL (CAAX protease family)